MIKSTEKTWENRQGLPWRVRTLPLRIGKRPWTHENNKHASALSSLNHFIIISNSPGIWRFPTPVPHTFCYAPRSIFYRHVVIEDKVKIAGISKICHHKASSSREACLRKRNDNIKPGGNLCWILSWVSNSRQDVIFDSIAQPNSGQSLTTVHIWYDIALYN